MKGVNDLENITIEYKFAQEFGRLLTPMEKEIISFYQNLSKKDRNKFLRRVRQIAKYNRTHNLEEFDGEENSRVFLF